jgi:hypothetical protein
MDRSPVNYLATSVVVVVVVVVATVSIGAAVVVSIGAASVIGTTTAVSSLETSAFFSAQEAKAKTAARDNNVNTFVMIVIIYSLFSDTNLVLFSIIQDFYTFFLFKIYI